MNEEKQLRNISFVKILVGIEKFQDLKPREKEDFLAVLMRYVLYQEAQLDETKQFLELARHDIEVLKGSHGVA
jgi:hypothetical protein